MTDRPRMTMAELIAAAQPLQGPGFNADEHIEDWSDDSSEEDLSSNRERTDEEILAELLMAGPATMEAMPIRRTVAAIYMPIRVNCLYG